MIYFHETKGDIKYYNMIEAIDDRARIDMQKSAYLKAYKEQTICEVCVYDLRLKKFTETHGVFHRTQGEIGNDDNIEAFEDKID